MYEAHRTPRVVDYLDEFHVRALVAMVQVQKKDAKIGEGPRYGMGGAEAFGFLASSALVLGCGSSLARKF